MARLTGIGIIAVFISALFCAATDAGPDDNRLGQAGERVTEYRYPENKANIGTGYGLENDSWLNFELLPLTDEVKVITNANMRKNLLADADDELKYEFEFQLLDTNSHIIKSGRYFHYTQIAHIAGGYRPAAYDLPEAWRPADGKMITINLDGIPDGGRSVHMRFRLIQRDERIADVLLRLYVPGKIPDRKSRCFWQAIGTRERDYLSRYHLVLPDFIPEDENVSLWRPIWQPLVPQGLEGRDYALYKWSVFKDLEGSPDREWRFRKGFQLASHSRITLPLPEEGAELKFVFSVSEERLSQPSHPITLTWFGENRLKEKRMIPLTYPETAYRARFEGGLIALSAQRPVRVQIFLSDKDAEIEVTPGPMRARTFTVDRQHPLTYRIAHGAHSSFPLRIVCRKRISESFVSRSTLGYVLLDRHEAVIKTGTLQWTLEPSLYDYIVNDEMAAGVSDPAVFYFNLSPQTAWVRFFSRDETLLRVYSRPSGMGRVIQVPEDYDSAGWQDEEKQMTWVPFSPQNFRALLTQRQSVIVGVQFRPPGKWPDRAAGDFPREPFPPGGIADGRYVMMPIDKGTVWPDDGRQSIFRELPTDRPVSVQLDSGILLNRFRPRLFFRRLNAADPLRLQVDVDHQAYFITRLMGAAGMVELPPITRGRHILHVHAADTAGIFMNTAVSDADGYRLGFAHRLGKCGLRFEYAKQSVADETLSMLVMFNADEGRRFDFNVRLIGRCAADEGPFRDISILNRHYSLRADRNGPVYLLNTASSQLECRQTCFFPLHADIRPGNYEVEIEVADKASGSREACLILYRPVPGARGEYRLSRESDG